MRSSALGEHPGLLIGDRQAELAEATQPQGEGPEVSGGTALPPGSTRIKSSPLLSLTYSTPWKEFRKTIRMRHAVLWGNR